jgi:hypothetical protein
MGSLKVADVTAGVQWSHLKKLLQVPVSAKGTVDVLILTLSVDIFFLIMMIQDSIVPVSFASFVLTLILLH